MTQSLSYTTRRLALDGLIATAILTALNAYPANIAIGFAASLCLVFVATTQDERSSIRPFTICAIYGVGLLAYAAGFQPSSLIEMIADALHLHWSMPALPGA